MIYAFTDADPSGILVSQIHCIHMNLLVHTGV